MVYSNAVCWLYEWMGRWKHLGSNYYVLVTVTFDADSGAAYGRTRTHMVCTYVHIRTYVAGNTVCPHVARLSIQLLRIVQSV